MRKNYQKFKLLGLMTLYEVGLARMYADRG